jgi:hypothetical protein
MANKAAWINDSLMVDVVSQNVTCDNLDCKEDMTCEGTFTCSNMVINSYSTANATIGTLTNNNLILPSITEDNALTQVLVRDPADSKIHYNSVISYPVTLPTTANTLAEFTGTAGQIASSTISVVGGNSLTNLLNVVGNDPASVLRMSSVQTSGIAEKTLNNGVFVSSTLNYTGGQQTTDVTKNQVIVRDPINVNQLQYRTDFIDTTSSQTMTNKILTLPTMAAVRNANNLNRTVNLPSSGPVGDQFLTSLSSQDVINKNLNAELTTLYANSGTNKRVRFDMVGASDNTNTILYFQQSADRDITFPDASGTLCLTSQLSAYVDLNSAQTLQNKTLGNNTRFIDNATAFQNLTGTKLLSINNNLASNGAITEITATSTSNRFINLPDASTTLIGDTNTATLTNKTISNLTAIGTSQSLLGGKETTTYFNLTTTTNTPTIVFTLPMVSGTSLTLQLDATVLCTLGAELDKVRGFSAVYVIKRTSLGVMASFVVSSSLAGDGGYNPTFSILLGPGNFSLQATGINANTLNWGGNYTINYR